MLAALGPTYFWSHGRVWWWQGSHHSHDHLIPRPPTPVSLSPPRRLLDIGIYPLAFVSMAYGGVMPTSVKATGTTHEATGVDTSAGVTALYADPATAAVEETAGSAPGKRGGRASNTLTEKERQKNTERRK